MSDENRTGIVDAVRAGDTQPGPRVRDRLDGPSGPGERRIAPFLAASAQEFTVQ